MSSSEKLMQQAENASVVVGLLETAITTGTMTQDFAAQVFETWLTKKFTDNDQHKSEEDDRRFSEETITIPSTPPSSPTISLAKSKSNDTMPTVSLTKSKKSFRNKINSLFFCGVSQLKEDSLQEDARLETLAARRKSIPLPKIPKDALQPGPIESPPPADNSVYCVYAVDGQSPQSSFGNDSVYDTNDDPDCYAETSDSNRGCASSFSSSDVSYRGAVRTYQQRISRSQSLRKTTMEEVNSTYDHLTSVSCPQAYIARVDSGINTLETIDYAGRGCLS